MKLNKKLWTWSILVLFITLGIGVKTALAEFPAEPSYTLNDIPCPYYLEAGDLNNDGHSDLVVSSWFRLPVKNEKYDPEKGRVFIFHQKNGQHNLPADMEIPISYPCALKIDDFDHDANNDLAFVDKNSFLHLFLGKDNLSTEYKHSNCNQFCRGPLVVGDIGSKGTVDFLIGPVWRQWRGGGNFISGYFYPPTKKKPNGSCLLKDLNQDGEMDVVFVSHRASPDVMIYYGPFLQKLVKATKISSQITITAPTAVVGFAIGDLNSDKRNDIIVSTSVKSPHGNKVVIYYQKSPVGFDTQAEPSITIEGITGGIKCADFNGDGLDDLMVVQHQSEYIKAKKICLFYQKEGKPFAKSIEGADQVLDIGGVRSVCHIQVADIDGNKFPDLIMSLIPDRSPNKGLVSVFLNRGTSTTADEEKNRSK